MYRKNTQHLQLPLLSDLDVLPEKLRIQLEESWAGTFYRDVFVRIDERPFAVLYSDEPSRPNTPINVLAGLDWLKSAFGWSDEEMYDHYCFDIQVRYALRLRNLGKGHFELRTMYNFRRRVAQHMQKTGENLGYLTGRSASADLEPPAQPGAGERRADTAHNLPPR